MAGKGSKQKVGFKDLVTFAKAGWTPDETNALLDRLDAMGDPNEPDLDGGNDDDNSDDDNIDIESIDDIDDDLDDDPGNQPDNIDESSDKDDKSAKDKLDRMKVLAYDDLVKKNERLENEIKRLRSKNRNKDVSDDTKSNKESLIDAFQSCF
jgi:hypothetical protein